jgi:hypothetical protein
MSLIKQSSAQNVAFFMVTSQDSITGLTGATVTVTISKNGAAFAAPAGTVTEIGVGWYYIGLTSADTGTLGDILIHATATGADPTDAFSQVVLDLPGATVTTVTGNVNGSVASVTGNVGGSVASVIGAVGSVTATVSANIVSILGSAISGTAASIAASFSTFFNVTGTGTVNNTPTVGSVTGNVGGNVTGSVGSVVATVAANLTQILGTALTETAGQLAAGFKKWFNVATPTSTMNEVTLVDTVTTVSTVSSVTTVGSVTGSVGSVTGSVGSVTGSVGSVAGNVGGNVVGSVGSVLATVSANLVGIIATALTETTPGFITAAFKKFFNIASPTSTMNEITLVDTLTTYTGNTPQTGDSFARLGAPAGASVSADILVVKNDVLAIPTNPLLASGYTAPNNAGIATLLSGVVVTTNNDKTGYALAASQIPFKKNTALAGFSFPMFSAAGVPLTGLTITAKRFIDGGAISSTTNAAVEVSNGFYKIDLSAADLNGNSISFIFTASGAVATTFTAVTQ